MTTLPVTYGYARVSKSDDDARNLETQLRLLADHGIREDLIFSDIATGRTLRRAGWQELMSRLRPGDTLAVAFLDRLSRNFKEGVRIQADLTRRDIGIVAIRENIDTSDGSAAAKFLRRSMLAQGAYQVDSTSERIRAKPCIPGLLSQFYRREYSSHWPNRIEEYFPQYIQSNMTSLGCCLLNSLIVPTSTLNTGPPISERSTKEERGRVTTRPRN